MRSTDGHIPESAEAEVMVCRCSIILPPRMVRNHDGIHGVFLLPDNRSGMPITELSSLWHSQFHQLVHSTLDRTVKMGQADFTYLQRSRYHLSYWDNWGSGMKLIYRRLIEWNGR